MLQYLGYLVFVGATVHILGSFAYLRDTLRGTTKPNRVTFLIWGIAPLIGVAAALTDGVGWAILPVFMAGFFPLVIFFASFVNPNAYWKLGRFDYICGFFSVLALVLWAVTLQPLIAIIFAIISDGFATFPTLIKAWKYPETETAIAYAASLFSAGTGFAAIQKGIPSEYIFGIYLVVVNALLVFVVYRRKIFKKEFAAKAKIC